jgi:hypothetical protein
MIQFEAAGALTEAEMWEKIETFVEIATWQNHRLRQGQRVRTDSVQVRPEWPGVREGGGVISRLARNPS